MRSRTRRAAAERATITIYLNSDVASKSSLLSVAPWPIDTVSTLVVIDVEECARDTLDNDLCSPRELDNDLCSSRTGHGAVQVVSASS